MKKKLFYQMKDYIMVYCRMEKHKTFEKIKIFLPSTTFKNGLKWFKWFKNGFSNKIWEIEYFQNKALFFYEIKKI